MKTIQMTIDERLLKLVDKMSRTRKTTRSAFIRDALEAEIQRQRIRDQEARHAEGYARKPIAAGEFAVLVWGGLRGAIPIALALSLPPGKEKELVLVCTYVVVVFSVFVQAPTIGPLTRRAMGRR